MKLILMGDVLLGMMTLFSKAALISAVFILTGCSFTSGLAQQQKETQRLETVFPLLAQYEVTAYRHQDWCQAIEYDGRAFANTSQNTCIYLLEAYPTLFSSGELERLNQIHDAIQKTGVKAHIIDEIRFQEDTTTSATFTYRGKSYVYQPDYTLPISIPNEREYSAIDENWYLIRQDLL